MKYLIAAGFCWMTAIPFLNAQAQGKITYEEKLDLHRRIPDDRAEMKDMIPHYRSFYYDLYYTEQASVYQMEERPDEDNIEGMHGGGEFHMHMSPPKRTVYKNLAEDKMVDEREFMTKLFLIKGQAAPFTWKIADGQKQILNFTCMQATYQDSINNYVVWFTPQIPISNGPSDYGGLPGMILQVDVNNGERVITATAVSDEAVDPDLLQEPKKGKEVTQEEFRQIMHEKMQEMRQAQGGPGGPGPVMIIHHD